jgi:hypothetical protein
MNGLHKIHRDMAFTGLVPLRYIVYMSMLSDISRFTPADEEVEYGVYSQDQADIYDLFADWEPDDVEKALNDLADEGLIWFDDSDRVYLGEFRGRRFFTFEIKSSLCDDAVDLLERELTRYSKTGSAKDRSRSRFIRSELDKWYDQGIESMNPGDFTELHGYLYEIYTGGEVYNIRNKIEYFQTNNMLKAYDRLTVFAILVEGVLHFDKYRKKGTPTLTNVAMMKDDVFRKLTHKEEGSKEYLRERAGDEETF